MRTDDAITGLRQGLTALHKRDHRGTATHDVIPSVRRESPSVTFLKPGEPVGQQTRLGTRHGVPGTGACVNVVDQILGCGRIWGDGGHGV
jgi:hypothetical protein